MRLSILQVVVWSTIVLMSGCGGSDSTAVNDPLAPNQQAATTTTTTTPPTGAGTVQNYTMSLSTVNTSGSSTVASNGSIIATATLKDSSGNLVSAQPIRFEEISTDSTSAVTIPTPIVSTSGGTATSIMKAADTTTNRDAIIQASTSINGQTISAVSIVKIVRSAGNYINFVTSARPTDPSGNLNRVIVQVQKDNPPPGDVTGVLQMVLVEVLDKDGIRRTGVPVTLTVYDTLGCAPEDVFITSPDGTQPRTVVTDNTGLGVFNTVVAILTPPPGGESNCSIIYKATTADPYSVATLFSYGAYISGVKNVTTLTK